MNIFFLPELIFTEEQEPVSDQGIIDELNADIISDQGYSGQMDLDIPISPQESIDLSYYEAHARDYAKNEERSSDLIL